MEMSHAIAFPDDDPEIVVIEEVLNKVRGLLGEHFDTGVVLLTRQSPEGITSYHSTEFGNKFALRGMVESYVDGDFDFPAHE